MSEPVKQKNMIKYIKDKLHPLKYLFINDIADDSHIYLIVGSARSGTNWLTEILLDNRWRYIREPFNHVFVKESARLNGCYFMKPNDEDAWLEKYVNKVLHGNLLSPFANITSLPFKTYNTRLIKSNFSHYFLKWLSLRFPRVKIIFLLRHPYPTCLSQLNYKIHEINLCWGSLTNNDKIVENILKPLNVEPPSESSEPYEKLIFNYCIENWIPLNQLHLGDAHFIVYEKMLLNPEDELRKLLDFLNLKWHDKYKERFTKPSSSTLKSRLNLPIAERINPHKSQEDSKYLDITRRFLELFELDGLIKDDMFNYSLIQKKLLANKNNNSYKQQ